MSATQTIQEMTITGRAGGNGAGMPSHLAAAIFTGGIDRPYAFGLSQALAAKGVKLDVIGSRELADAEICSLPEVSFLEFHGDQRGTKGLLRKLVQHLLVYARLIRYGVTAKPRIFHILWNYKLDVFDRIVLMLYYRLLSRKIVLTAHNVNSRVRDGNDSAFNRMTLKAQYRLSDHIFVHTEKMKSRIAGEFGVRAEAITVIPFGINNSVPDTALTPSEAKRQLGIDASEKTILFFGHIRPYKGLDHLVKAFGCLVANDRSYRLVIAGGPKKDAARLWHEIQQTIETEQMSDRVIQAARFISDAETELYFKAADVVVLPYTEVFQSGVLFLAYNFGLPVIATDVGSLRDDIVEGETGYICRPGDPDDLAVCIEKYFGSNLFRSLGRRRAAIKAFAAQRNSWAQVSEQTCAVYEQLIAR